MTIAWHIWPVNIILTLIVAVSLGLTLWLLGCQIWRVTETRLNGNRMTDLICLERAKEDLEQGLEHLRQRQQKIHDELHSLNEDLRRPKQRTPDENSPR